MTVYVDRFIVSVPPQWEGGGHLLTSDLAELHAFAANIGLKRRWFQDKTFPHYDLTKSRRAAALRTGATSIEPGEFPDDLLVRCPDGGHEPYAARVARRSTTEGAST